jgi:hypothetical protein
VSNRKRQQNYNKRIAVKMVWLNWLALAFIEQQPF